MMLVVFYIGKKEGDELKLDFLFSIGNLNNENGVIPRNELDVIERGTRQCEKLLDWMTPLVKRKILITDAKVPLLWLRNKELRTQPYVQTRVHSMISSTEHMRTSVMTLCLGKALHAIWD